MTQKTPITVAHGDGIGPEIMQATLLVLKEAGANLEPETIEIGEKVYLRGCPSGIEASAWSSLRKTKVFLKAPVTTPQGGGFKSLNVTTRKTLGLYANVRPCIALHPFVETRHPKMDVVIVRENEEDLYAGIEHRQTRNVMQCLKLISRPGCEKIVRYAFEYAKLNNRKKVTCFSKDNIMKLTDGLFHKVFNEIGKEYPDITQDHFIIDIGTARLADVPEKFDVIVTSNLYGDIISDVAAEISGSVGLGGSVNIGDHCAMFEAIHGSAPDIAGKDIANPSGLLLSAVMMLVHIGQPQVAERIHNAWLKTIEEGVHTGDIFNPQQSRQQVGTQAFAKAVIQRLGQTPVQLKPVSYNTSTQSNVSQSIKAVQLSTHEKKELVGIDVFIDWLGSDVLKLADILSKIEIPPNLKLQMISNRGVKVWPDGFPETFCVDHWRCRYKHKDNVNVDSPTQSISHKDITMLLNSFADAKIDFIKTEHLYTFDGVRGYSAGQGE